MKRYVIFIVSVIAILSAYAGYEFGKLSNENVEPTNAEINSPGLITENLVGSIRPVFTLPDLNKRQRHVSEWKNKIIVLNFWATWCPPCREEIPVFIELQEKYAGRGLQFVGIVLQDAAEVIEFYKEFKMNYPVLTGEQDVITIARQYGNFIGGLPYTVFIDKHDRITFIKQGPISREKTEEIILSLL